MILRNSTFAPPLLLLSAFVILFQGCDSGNQGELPFISFTNVASGARVTTNNRSLTGPGLVIQGNITNMDPADVASFQVINNLGAFPDAAPGASLSLDGVGNFSIQIPTPLVNATLPVLDGDSTAGSGNAFVVRAANDFSPVNGAGDPIPAASSVIVYLDNQVVFTNPAYATPTGPGTVDTTCDLQTSNAISGTFSVPAGTVNAATVITNAVVVARADADRFADPTDPSTDAATKSITVNADGTFSVTIDNSGWSGGYDPTVQAQADSNFLIRFDTTNPRALPAPGTLGTFPFQDCLL